jgi:hypothetical protein
MMIDVVCFKKVEVDEVSEDKEDTKGKEEGKAKKPVISPVTIWIGIFPESTSTMAAHDTAQDILALLKDYQITDIKLTSVSPSIHVKLVLSFSNLPVIWTHSLTLLVFSLLPLASASLPRQGLSLRGQWPSTLLKVVL